MRHLGVGLLLLAVACSDDDTGGSDSRTCAKAGTVEDCAGKNSCDGTRECLEANDGTLQWSACVCSNVAPGGW